MRLVENMNNGSLRILTANEFGEEAQRYDDKEFYVQELEAELVASKLTRDTGISFGASVFDIDNFGIVGAKYKGLHSINIYSYPSYKDLLAYVKSKIK